MKIKQSVLDAQKSAIKASLAKRLTVRKTAGERQSTNGPLVEVNPNYSLIKYIKGCHFGDWEKAENEHAVAKAYGTDKPTHGGFFLPEVIAPDIIERLREQSILDKLPGIRRLDMGDARQVMYNRVASSVTITWGGENETISEDESFSTARSTLVPHKTVCLYKDSRELFEHAPAFEDLMRQDVSEGLALDLDTKVFEGLGGNTLLGIYYNPLVPLTDLSGAIDEDNIKDAINAMRIVHSKMPTAYVTYPTVQKKLAQLKDAEGRPIFGTGPGMMFVTNLDGVPIHGTTQIGATLRPSASETYMVAGDWSQFILGNWGGFRVEVTTEGGDAFAKDQVHIKFVRWVGDMLRHDDAFHIIKGIDIS